jgi:hypothetical protein
MGRWALVVAAAVLGGGAAVGCGGGGHSGQTSLVTPDGGADASVPAPDDAGAAKDPLACPDIFDPGTLQTYAFDISDAEWAGLQAEFADINDVLAGNPMESYHPIVFHFGNETVTDAMVRLKGQSSWVLTEQFDVNPKMQFSVSFDQVNANGKFHGVSELVFDMPRTDWTFLNERLTNTWLRQIGIMAPCANSAKLYINGAYYGLYVSEESKGGHLLKEFFPGANKDDLIKGGTETSNGTDRARLNQFWSAGTLDAMSRIVDVPSSLLDWAAEVVFNDADGYYGGQHNFYIYDQGPAGYVWLPTDVDSTLGYLGVFAPSVSYHQHPIYWWAGRVEGWLPGPHYMLVINDKDGRARYVDAIATQLQKWRAAEMQDRLDDWSDQIADAVAADPRRWATVQDFHSAVATTRDMMARRPAFLQSFVDCERTGSGADADGDGFRWCEDCDDGRASAHPGAPETCNGADDNCNGLIDEGCPPPPPPPPAPSPTPAPH